MFNTQYFMDAISSAEKREAFAIRFSKKHDENPERYADFMSRLITHNRSVNNKAAAVQRDAATLEGEAQRNALEMYSNLGIELTNITHLIQRIKWEVERNGQNRWALAMIRLDFDKCLGTVKNLSRLRSFMSDMDGGNDWDELQEYLKDRLDIMICYECEDWEYDSRRCETYSGDYICRECADSNYRFSSRYEQYVYGDDARDALDENGNDCVIHYDDSDFTYDDDRDQYVHDDYQCEPVILGSYHSSKRSQNVIHDEWSDARSRWLGVELEVELRGDSVNREEKASELNNVINDGEIGRKVFFETDGSLNNGIEIISQPMSLPAHRDLWNWLKNPEAVRSLRSHNTTTCGLHVHVSRQPMTQDQIAKMVLFVNDRGNEALIKAIARRYAEGYCRIKEKSLETAHYSSDRYEAINITSDKTVEFRIFKGSLKYESVIAAIEFANALTDFTRTSAPTVQDLTTDRFMDFIHSEMADETQVLRPYIANRLELA